MNPLTLFRSCQLYLDCTICLVPRRLSFDENVRAKEGGKDNFPWSLAVHHQSLGFRARLCHAKHEAPEEEAAVPWLFVRHVENFLILIEIAVSKIEITVSQVSKLQLL